MADYDFGQLSDKEFEVFCCDLLSLEFSRRFERFKSGRDGGVDGRFFTLSGEVVLQCKHWPGTPLPKLLSALSSKEAAKVAKVAPDRYIFATSLALSRTDKLKIQSIFAPYLRSPDDVLGREDLNDILARHGDVERRHYKLWVASSNVLNSILHAPIYGRSDFLLSDIIADSARYVVTRNHELATERLQQKQVIIITGEAGIGKTTLAKNILLPFLEDGYELFCISEKISEAEGVFKRNTKQIFYFDDFLGSNYLDALSGNSGAQVVSFIRRVRADPLKRFVLTSRTTILNQGKILINALASENSSREEFEISLQSLSRLDKAKILYNHIWHSDLPDEFKDEIYLNRRYREVVDHKNYNPRIIQFVTDSQRLEGVDAGSYWSYILRMLSNPADVWAHPFDAQHDEYGRAIVILVALNGQSISQQDLAEAYGRYIALPRFSSARGHSDFLVNLRHLCGSMLNRVIYGTSQFLSLFNPSIRDFVLSRYSGDKSVLKAGLLVLRSEESITVMRGLLSNSHVEQKFVVEMLVEALREAYASAYIGYKPGYIARAYLLLADLVSVDEIKRRCDLAGALAFVEREDLPRSFEEVLDFFALGRTAGFMAPQSICQVIEQGCERDPTIFELQRLADLMRIEECDEATSTMFRSSVMYFFSEQLYDEFARDEVFYGLGWDERHRGARSQLDAMIFARLEPLGLSYDSDLVREIASGYDFDDQAERYFSGSDEVDSPRGARSIDLGDDIDDLFART